MMTAATCPACKSVFSLSLDDDFDAEFLQCPFCFRKFSLDGEDLSSGESEEVGIEDLVIDPREDEEDDDS